MDPRASVAELVEGAWDIHVHAAPSIFPRWGDAADLAAACAAARMAGFVLKFHHGSSVEAAATAMRAFPGVKAFGGITLNHFLGGLNPTAVDCALALGAKILWLPTIHAAHHAVACGCLGGFKFQEPLTRLRPKSAIRILGQDGRVVGELREILSLLDGADAALGTGHLSPEEIFAVHSCIRKEGLRIRLLVNHVSFAAPTLTIGQLRELANGSTWFEQVHLCVSKLARSSTPRDIAKMIHGVPEARWVLASDSGQAGNLRAPEALAEFASLLSDEGVSRAYIRKMMVDEPRSLLFGE